MTTKKANALRLTAIFKEELALSNPVIFAVVDRWNGNVIVFAASRQSAEEEAKRISKEWNIGAVVAD